MSIFFKNLFKYLLLLPVLSLSVQGEPIASWTIKVLDEEQRPVTNATVSMGFERDYQADQRLLVEGKSDNYGYFSGEAPTDGDVIGGASKNGYYDTSGVKMEFKTFDKGRWQPRNPTNIIVLKRIINPVPMYAKRVETKIPIEKQPVGFDFIAGDWVVPYGKGITNDIIITLSRRFIQWEDFDITLQFSFSNPSDGIQEIYSDHLSGSLLRLPHRAPVNNYQKSWKKTIGNNLATGQNITDNPDNNFIFRIRTQLDPKHSIVSAMYGKIHGDIMITGYGAEKVILIFAYYLNPDGTRNMEFDPKRNLFKNLKEFEQVHEP